MKEIQRDDTIVALATATGQAAIAVIRLSGPESIEIADRIFVSKRGKKKSLADSPSHRIYFGTIEENGKLIDEVLVSLMKLPNSYTGEDTVEISCHGSMYIQQRILRLCQSSGARLAEPGEFTMRAFLNGKMDLSQAEAVADLIASDSAATHQLALKQMRGGFSEEIKTLRRKLIDFASLIELELDFSEEDVEFASRDDLKEVILQLNNVITDLIASFDLGNVIRKGIPVVIAGKPNAGKSTLLNALLNEERAIVSEIAGTTRDTVEEEVVLEGIKFRFIDTAGIRESENAIEKIGVSKTYEKMSESPLILYVFDIQHTNADALKTEMQNISNLNETIKVIPVANKMDLAKNGIDVEIKSMNEIFFISAKEKTNIEQLRKKLLSMYSTGKINANNSIVTSARHAGNLKKTSDDLMRVYAGLKKNLSNDLIASDLRQALIHLGEITGEISTEDLLENIFSRFCIGK